jgi:ParB-like chromosome segregation protein Spo0J
MKEMDVDPHRIKPPHEVRDADKFTRLAKDMQAHGWKGRPLLVFPVGDHYQALTGSHRHAAALEAKLEAIPVAIIDLDQCGLSEEEYEEAEKKLMDWFGYYDLRINLKALGLQEALDLLMMDF